MTADPDKVSSLSKAVAENIPEVRSDLGDMNINIRGVHSL
jgi:hypothetical protein